jgi:hypothetical protein
VARKPCPTRSGVAPPPDPLATLLREAAESAPPRVRRWLLRLLDEQDDGPADAQPAGAVDSAAPAIEPHEPPKN